MILGYFALHPEYVVRCIFEVLGKNSQIRKVDLKTRLENPNLNPARVRRTTDYRESQKNC